MALVSCLALPEIVHEEVGRTAIWGLHGGGPHLALGGGFLWGLKRQGGDWSAAQMNAEGASPTLNSARTGLLVVHTKTLNLSKGSRVVLKGAPQPVRYTGLLAWSGAASWGKACKTPACRSASEALESADAATEWSMTVGEWGEDMSSTGSSMVAISRRSVSASWLSHISSGERDGGSGNKLQISGLWKD